MLRSHYSRLSMLAIFACASFSVAATAGVKQAVWTGTIASGFDTAGIFGAAGTDLGGFSYTAVFRYDPSLGIRFTTAEYDIAYGGSVYGAPTPMSYAAITINGVTRTIQTGNQDDVATNPAVGAATQIRYDYDVAGETRTDFLRLDGFIPGWPSLDDNLSATVVPGSSGSLMLINAPIYAPYQPNDAWADLGNYKTFTVTDVPEPASWMLMIAGFGLTGLGLRRRAAQADNRVAGAEPA